jgi:glycosyltransferase involved in cell wall biosynthesis
VSGRPSVLTIHDLAFLREPECAYPTLRAYLAKVVPRSARRATRIIAVSESTRQDVIELLRIAPERVVTIHEGMSRPFSSKPDPTTVASVTSRLGIRGPYILAVGTLEPRKNYTRLIQAYALLRSRGVRHRLIIAGARGWLYEPIFRTVRQKGLDGEVAFVRPSDSDLAALYAGAGAFVFPSLYEGFGIPPLEALASGVPSAVSNRASMPEVVDDAAVQFDPTDVEDIAEATERILSDQRLREELVRRGPERAERFTWDRAAEDTVRVYREVAGA